MSKIALQGNASGTGTLTIAAPNTNSNYTIDLPAGSGTLVTSGGAQTIEFAAGTVSAPGITFTGDTNTGIYSPAADTIAFTEGGTEAMRITSSGNVGIGTSSPSVKLHVKGAANYDGVIRADNSTTTGGGTFSVAQNGAAVGFLSTNGTAQGNTGADLALYSETGKAITFFTNGSTTERMRITSAGGVSFGSSGTDYGTAGQVLTSQGNASPTWTTISSGGATGISGQVFSSNGTFTIPSGVTALKVTVVGAGGSGARTSDYGGGGGGAGGAAIKYLTGLTPGNTLSVTVGTGGAARTTNSAGAAGGNSSVASGTQTITTIQGNGGSGGNLVSSTSFGGAGGAASGGDINITGSGGATHIYVQVNTCIFYKYGGIGGASIFPSYGQTNSTTVNSGTGSGGTGTLSSNSGAGGNGIVIFEW